jgi:hypothetical protein
VTLKEEFLAGDLIFTLGPGTVDRSFVEEEERRLDRHLWLLRTSIATDVA